MEKRQQNVNRVDRLGFEQTRLKHTQLDYAVGKIADAQFFDRSGRFVEQILVELLFQFVGRSRARRFFYEAAWRTFDVREHGGQQMSRAYAAVVVAKRFFFTAFEQSLYIA